MNTFQKIGLLAHRSKNRANAKYISTCSVLMGGHTTRLGAAKHCVVFNNIATMIKYRYRSVCLHMPVAEWQEGDWRHPFQICPSIGSLGCDHWEHSAEATDKLRYAFRIEYFHKRFQDGTRSTEDVGTLFVVLPLTVMRGPSALNVFKEIQKHLRKNTTVY